MDNAINLSASTVNQINDYVRKLSYGYINSSGEIEDFKEEIRSNLIISIKDLVARGYHEEEALKISLDRLGDVKNIRHDLKGIYKLKFLFGKWLFKIAIVLGVLGLLIQVGLYNWAQYKMRLEVTDIFNRVHSNIGSGDVIVTQDMRDSLEIAIRSSTFIDAIGIQNHVKTASEKVEFMYVYPQDTKINDTQLSNTRTGLILQNASWNNAVYIPNSDASIFVMLKVVFIREFVFTLAKWMLILYWALFALDFAINIIYQEKNRVWILAVVFFNVIGYAFYKIIENKKAQTKTVMNFNEI